MRVRPETLSSSNHVVVQYPKRTKVHVLRIVVVRERKRKMSIQPAAIGMAASLALCEW
jgi:outer membrane lipopolysaccharide assembly protein LptE/RlpB